MKLFFLEKPNLDEFETIFGEVISKWSRQSSHLINVCVNVVLLYIQLLQLKFSPEQSGKVEYERERLLGIANKIHSFPAAFRARIRLFRFARGIILIEIAVYIYGCCYMVITVC
jgi:hypothetical protein